MNIDEKIKEIENKYKNYTFMYNTSMYNFV